MEMTASQRLNVQLDDLADGAFQAINERGGAVHAACLSAAHDLRMYCDDKITAVVAIESLRTMARRAAANERAAGVFTETAALIVDAEAEVQNALLGIWEGGF